jgi:hypothetical protein
MNIKYYIQIFSLIFCSFLFLSSCNKDEEYKEILNEVTKIKIIPFILENENNVNSNDYFIEINNIEEIKNLIKFSSSGRYACGYNGKIEYYSINNLLFMGYFNTECNTIVFIYNNKEYDKHFSTKGNVYLKEVIKNIEIKYNKKNIIGLYD